MYKARINNNTDTKIVSFSNIDDIYRMAKEYGELWGNEDHGEWTSFIYGDVDLEFNVSIWYNNKWMSLFDFSLELKNN